MTTREKDTRTDAPPEIEAEGTEEAVDDAPAEGAPAWMATYGDMVTLLFAFFVLLYSMSSVQQESFKELVQSLRSALGVQQVPEAGTREGLVPPAQPDIEKPPETAAEQAAAAVAAKTQHEIDQITKDVWELIMFNQLGGQVRVEGNELGATITISDVILFPAGQSRLTDGGVDIIRKIFNILREFSYHIKVAGHTDNLPIRTAQFASNWELSATRACEVVRLLIDSGISPDLLSAVGYAEFRPIAENDTPEGRAHNRRVEIIYEREAIKKKIGEKQTY